MLTAVVVSMKTAPGLNAREHWAARAKRVKNERTVVHWELKAKAGSASASVLPCSVLLVRYSAGKLDDDNLRGALKAVRDGVADWLGVDDADPRVRWDYDQAPAKRGNPAVGITVSALPALPP